jgi:YHS domain-containing protein
MKKMLLGFTMVAALGCKANPPPATAAAPIAAATPTAATPGAADPAPFAAGTKMKCVVTGEEFTVGAKTTQIVYEGKRYAFCCNDCLPEFNKNPAKFAQKN